MAERRLLRVSLPWACFGLDVRDGRIVGGAPIARWCVGRSAAWCLAYWARRGAVVEWLTVDDAD